MAKRLQLRGGTTSQHSTFTGALREVTVDTDKDTLVVHDGATAGGIPLATSTNLTTLSATNLTSGTVPDARLSSSVATLTGTQTLTNKTLTSPKINEDVAVTSTATELNLLDGKAATNLALLGKTEGTNFGNSLLVGHATTGTLNSANANTGVGIIALDALTYGDDNVGLGYSAGTNVNSGNRNSYLGADSGRRATTGSDNTVVGSDAGYYNVTGSNNTSLGSNTLEGVDGNSFSNNTAIGSSALKAITTGASNIGFGKDAGDNITSGDGNVIIGSINADSATGDKQLILADGVDGSVAWIKGDSSANVVIGGTVTEYGGASLTTTGKALVMGF